jgi:GNAT superfamily N-acetyltransferase
MEFIIINIDNLDLLKEFFSNNDSPFFRYYSKRKYEDAIKNHKYTVILKYNNDNIGYGHIDFEDKFWIGLFIDNKYHNKGYGKILLKHLIDIAKDYSIDELYLSVDNENTVANYIYQKKGFKVVNSNQIHTIMSLSLDIINLPVSYGEAFDKLSILDIKLKKIKDNRVNDVKKEYDMIKDRLDNIMTNNVRFYYNILKKINENIWDKQDVFRESTDINLKNKLCIDIIDDNDRRFRVKHKINNLLNSSLKEQKGYIKKKAFILTHLGLGDHITSMGIVRYYSTFYDELHIVCKKKYESNVRLLYQDDNTIHIYPIDTSNIRDDDISIHFGFSKKANAKYTHNGEDYDLITTGMFGPISTKSYTIPFCFYKDVELDYSIFWEYSYIIDTDSSKSLYNELIKNNIKKYIICQRGCSSNSIFHIEQIENKSRIDRNSTLIIDIEKNIYSVEHPYYEIANKFVMKPLIDYKDTIINASEIYTSDSCLFCIAMLLNIKTDKCYIFPRSRISSQYNYIFTDEFKYNPNNTKNFIGL